MVSCLFRNKESLDCETKVPLVYYYLSTLYVEIILEDTISRVFSHSYVGVIFEIYILCRSHKLADADPGGTLDL